MTDLFITKILLKRDQLPEKDIYPYNIPAISALDEINLTSPVTFLVGENGTGKSTLLEAVAVNAGFNAEGGSRNFNFSTYKSHSTLHEHFKLIRGAKRPADGFFLRAESYYNVASYIEELDGIPASAAPIKASYGGKSLHECSHGESFFALLVHRLGGRGLYLFDEPEAALSPARQLAMLRRIHELVGDGSQFIIATHSPILMSYPLSAIINFDDGLNVVEYEKTEHFTLMKSFITGYKGFQKTLFED